MTSALYDVDHSLDARPAIERDSSQIAFVTDGAGEERVACDGDYADK